MILNANGIDWNFILGSQWNLYICTQADPLGIILHKILHCYFNIFGQIDITVLSLSLRRSKYCTFHEEVFINCRLSLKRFALSIKASAKSCLVKAKKEGNWSREKNNNKVCKITKQTSTKSSLQRREKWERSHKQKKKLKTLMNIQLMKPFVWYT